MDEKQASPTAYNEGTERYPVTAIPGFAGDQSSYPSSYPPQQRYGGLGDVAQPGYARQPGYQSPQQGYNSNQSTVVVTQPVAANPMVSSGLGLLILAILTTIFCFWPIGIFAILRASEFSAALAAGDIRRALTLHQASCRFSLLAIAAGCILAVVLIVVYFVLPYNN